MKKKREFLLVSHEVYYLFCFRAIEIQRKVEDYERDFILGCEVFESEYTHVHVSLCHVVPFMIRKLRLN